MQSTRLDMRGKNDFMLRWVATGLGSLKEGVGCESGVVGKQASDDTVGPAFMGPKPGEDNKGKQSW